MNTIGRNTMYNLAGFGVPLVLFLVTIPIYVSLIGPARYGVLSIVWLVLGLFGMMDLGLGRAATQKVAALRDASAEDRRAALGTALATNIAIGSIGAIVMGVAGWLIFGSIMKLEPWLRAEALPVVPLMAIGVPVMTTLGILIGALQGREKFLITNRITIANAALFQLLPLGVAWLIGPQLWPLVVAALAARLLAALLLARECRIEFGAGLLRSWRRVDMVAMLRYGGWVTAAGFIGMILVFSDRFLIGAVLGAVAVTIYAIPLDATRRIAILADSVANALFPRLAMADAEESRTLTDSAVSVLYSVSTPLVAVFIVMADPLLRLWLGDELGAESGPLARILAIAAWANIFAKAPYAQLQAQNRPRVVALIMLAQLPFFLIGLWWALQTFGLVGAAWAYLLRNTVDSLALSLAAQKRLPRGLLVSISFVLLIAGEIWLGLNNPLSLAQSTMLAIPVALLTAAAAWWAAPAKMRKLALSLLRWPRNNAKPTP